MCGAIAEYRLSPIEHVDRRPRPHNFELYLQGFNIGKTAKHRNGSLATIVDIDDKGKVVLAELGADGSAGEPSAVQYEEFCNNYSPSTAVIEVIAGWLDKRPSSQQAYKEYTAKAAITLAMRRMSEIATWEDSLRLHAKPTRMVTATSNIPKGKLLTVPETMKMMMIEPTAVVPTGGLGVQLPKAVCDKVLVLMPHFASDFIVPAWAIRTTEDETKSNIEIVHKAVLIEVGSGKGKDKGKETSAIEIRIPILTNSKPIGKDDELLMYRPLVEKKAALKRGLASLALQDPSALLKRSNAQGFD